MDKVEAEKSLKALNSDLINLADKTGETDEVKAIRFLLNQCDSPFPFRISNHEGMLKNFNFNEQKGNYLWNGLQKKFEKTGNRDEIVIQMDSILLKPATFIITAYESAVVSSQPEFPVKMNAYLMTAGDTTMKLQLSSKITDGLPEWVELNLTGNDYEIQLHLKRTRLGDEGTMNCDMEFKVSGSKVTEVHFDSKIGYSRQGYFFNYIKYHAAVFSHRVEGYCNYANVNPTAVDYARSFNDNTKTELFEGKNRKIGDVILTVSDDELLGFSIRFGDGSLGKPEDYLILYRKIMNLKY